MTSNDSPQEPHEPEGADDMPDDLAEIDEPWTLGPQLAQLLASSDHFDREISDQVDRRLRARSMTSDVLDLVGLGWSTMRVLLIKDPTPADSEPEGY